MSDRDHQIQWHIERAFSTLCSMRRIDRQRLQADVLAYMRGVGSLQTSYAIANALKAICESDKITPRVEMFELFGAIENFIEQEARAA